MKLNEDQARAKVIELLDGMDQRRMDMWIISGCFAGVLDSEMVERLMIEELPKRSHEVIEFWGGPCNCTGHLN